MKDYYKILEIPPSAAIYEIKSQHRFLVHAWHPDKFPNPEQKVKAEEKLKEINEAYSTLSDPEKRKIYDLISGRSANKTSEEKSNTQKNQTQNNEAKKSPINNVYPNDQRNICESCGMPIETKYVEIYQNIGLLIMRRFVSVKGRFCKSCIEYYFWTMTGKTMLFGWWGVISFLMTPFLLINNYIRYISSLRMEKPQITITPKPSPFWIFSSLGGILLVGYIFILFSGGFNTSSYMPTMTGTHNSSIQFIEKNTSETNKISNSTPTRTPTKTITKFPLKTPTILKTSTSASNFMEEVLGCIKWSKVTKSMIGESKCVYGEVYKTQFIGGNTFQILFSVKENSFFLATGTSYYDVGGGDCVRAAGLIREDSIGVPYINIDHNLFECVGKW